jgi:hypothetical protein
MLVYAERHGEIEPAIAREKLVKKWRREWKFALIEADNTDWLDLWDQWYPAAEARPKGSQAPCQARGDGGLWWRLGGPCWLELVGS